MSQIRDRKEFMMEGKDNWNSIIEFFTELVLEELEQEAQHEESISTGPRRTD